MVSRDLCLKFTHSGVCSGNGETKWDTRCLSEYPQHMDRTFRVTRQIQLAIPETGVSSESRPIYWSNLFLCLVHSCPVVGWYCTRGDEIDDSPFRYRASQRLSCERLVQFYCFFSLQYSYCESLLFFTFFSSFWNLQGFLILVISFHLSLLCQLTFLKTF